LPHLLRRAVALTALSAVGIALLAPLAARSAPPAPAAVPVPLLSGAVLERGSVLADRGGTTVREAALAATAGAESFAREALPTPATAPMEATIVVIPTPTPKPAPVVAAVPRPAAPTYSGSSVWDDLARCESGGNWAINTGNGYYGGLQFSYPTWHGYDGGEFAEYPHEATREEQIIVAERLRAARGYQPWPACRAKLGLP
jgi:Transglycosylase-like domain